MVPMTFERKIQITSEASSWLNGIIPPEIASRMRLRDTNISRALLHIGLWTRPPFFHGFDLADCWAWLRYSRMFASGPYLRLRSEWTDIDPHQKTVASDELGVGFTTQFLIEELGFQVFVDTGLLCKLLPSIFMIGNSIGKKYGPQKTPDYVAYDCNGCFSILECKGSQTSPKDLLPRMQSGQLQKANLTIANSMPFRYSLVAGLFVPQAGNKKSPMLKLIDPSWPEVAQLLTEAPRRELLISIARIALAKHFSLMGLPLLSNRLMSFRESDPGFPHLFNRDESIRRQVKGLRDHLDFSIHMPLPPLAIENHDVDTLSQARGVRFYMKCETDLFDELITSDDINESLYRMMLGLSGESGGHAQRWVIGEDTNTSFEIRSPLGFLLGLEYLI